MEKDDEEIEVDEVDLEEAAKSGRKPARARRYRLRIDKEYRTTTKPVLTGREILALVDKTPEKYVLTQKVHKGGTVPITADQKVDLRAPGIERFMTLARDATDGDKRKEKRRLDFQLRQRDVEALDATGLRWETIKDAGGVLWIFLYDYPLPPGYSSVTVTLALMIVPGYPDAQIDMVFVSPLLQLKSGRALNAVSPRDINGFQFQQWSRHRTAANPWRPDLDDVGTHLVLVADWFAREIR